MFRVKDRPGNPLNNSKNFDQNSAEARLPTFGQEEVATGVKPEGTGVGTDVVKGIASHLAQGNKLLRT